MWSLGCFRKNKENNDQAVEQGLPKKGLSPRTNDIIGSTFWLSVCCVAMLAALGLILWAATTNVGFCSDTWRWVALGWGIQGFAMAFLITFTVAVVAFATLTENHHRQLGDHHHRR